MSSRYESVALDAIPPGCQRALDVGCGNGYLTRALRDRGIPQVTGIDRNEPCIERCQAHPAAGSISYLNGDVLTSAELKPGGYDMVTAVASLHHMDARAGLTRLRDLVAPGGVLAVIGLARPDWPQDIPRELAALIVNRLQPDPRRHDTMPKPPIIWPPDEHFSTMRRLASELLPGVRWHRHLLWRYSLVWANPR